MILKQYYLTCLSQASYLVGDAVSGRAAVIDPRRDVDVYVEDAEALGLRIEHVVLTHLHADFVSGHLELRARCGARIHLGAAAQADYEVTAAHEGDVVDLGGVRLAILETPGHTPESICILAFDLAKDIARPHAVFTGDTLFIGDVGRPDLAVAGDRSERELAAMLHDSLHRKLLTLPDETLVYPGHGAGSSCGKNLSTDTVSTIGAQRRSNLALLAPDRDTFVSLITAGQPMAPPYFPHDADYNRRERPTLDATLARALHPLSLEAALEAVAAGAQLLDTRDPDAFARGHLAGSVNVGLGGRFAEWAGTVLTRDAPIVLVAEEGKEKEAVLRLGRIGFDHVAGFLRGGFAATAARPDLVRTTERIPVAQLVLRLGSSRPPLVLDVRGPGEREAERIQDSAFIPAQRLLRLLAEVPKDRPLAVHCASGYRSSIAASLLRRAGFEAVTDIAGGIAAWKAAGLPTVTGEA